MAISKLKIAVERDNVQIDMLIDIVRVARALRHLKKSRSYVAGFVVDADDDTDKLFRATVYWLTKGMDDEFFQKSDIRVSSIEKDREKQQFSDYEFGRAVSIFFADSEYMSVDLLAACDHQAYFPPPSPRDLQIAMYHLRGIHLSEADAELMLRHRSRLNAVVLPGRPVARIMSVLRDMTDMTRAKRFSPLLGTERKEPVVEQYSTDGPRLEVLTGYGEAKNWGLDLANDLNDYRNGRLPWSHVSKGLLLSGPPGCGKTTFAQALANTCGVPLITGSYAQWQSFGHQGDMLKAMRKAFKSAKDQAPAILLIDEVDNFVDRDGSDRDNADYNRGVVNGLLQELDGADGREGVIVVGACNNPKIVDAAVRRPGRLDHHIEIPIPDLEAREGIFLHHLRKAGYRFLPRELMQVAELSEGESGAAIEKVVRDAVRRARRLARPLTIGDLLECLPERIVLSEEYQRRAAVHEIGHALVGALTSNEKLELCAIAESYSPSARENGGIGGGVKFASSFATIRTKDYYLGQIATMLAASVAEEMIYGDAADGRTHDLAQATNFATMIEVHLGYGATLISEPETDHKTLQAMRLRDRDIQRRVETTLREQMERARTILEEHRDLVISLADLLYREKSIEPSVIHRALEKRKLQEAC